jgi:pimeloyl-ACP methyl ester carboxylesterase
VLARNVVGSGPPLLLINGYAATGADWDPTFLAALGQSFEVICPDNRGVGGSERGTGELTIATMAADLEALLDELGVERCAVAGWSMGGFIAQELTRQAPGRVTSLALLATDPGGPEAVPADPAAWARLTDHAGSDREQATRLISLLFPPPLAAQIDAEFGALVAEARAALDPEVLREQEAAMEGWHRERGAASPSATTAPPTLILHGDSDEVIPVANAAPLAARWPGAEVEVLAGGGHALMAQEAERVAGRIRSFNRL